MSAQPSVYMLLPDNCRTDFHEISYLSILYKLVETCRFLVEILRKVTDTSHEDPHAFQCASHEQDRNKELNTKFMTQTFGGFRKNVDIKQARPLRCAQVPHFPKLLQTCAAVYNLSPVCTLS